MTSLEINCKEKNYKFAQNLVATWSQIIKMFMRQQLWLVVELIVTVYLQIPLYKMEQNYFSTTCYEMLQ